MRKMHGIRFLTGILLGLVVFISCSDDDSGSVFDDSEYEAYTTAFIALTQISRGADGDYIYVLVTDGKGNPLGGKRVDWEIVQGEGTLQYQTTVTKSTHYTTEDRGLTFNRVSNLASDEVQVKATVFGYDASVIATVKK